MTTPIWTTYWHRQWAPFCLILYVLAAGIFGIAWVLRLDPLALVVLSGVGILMLLLSASFHHLTVSDEGVRLLVAFGPVPLFRRNIRYDDIREVEIGRTMILDGWGIHLSFRGGWVWNIWGRDCVVLRLRRGIIRIGTDDAENLARFVQNRLTAEADP